VTRKANKNKNIVNQESHAYSHAIHLIKLKNKIAKVEKRI
jgi:hypothetical protein